MENIVAEVTFQFWAIFGQFLAFFGNFWIIFGQFTIIVQGYLSKHIFHTVLHREFLRQIVSTFLKNSMLVLEACVTVAVRLRAGLFFFSSIFPSFFVNDCGGIPN